MNEPVYVVLARRWKTRAKVWETVLYATAERPETTFGEAIAIFEVTHATKSSACAVVFEWLLKGQPSAMTVRKIK